MKTLLLAILCAGTTLLGQTKPEMKKIDPAPWYAQDTNEVEAVCTGASHACTEYRWVPVVPCYSSSGTYVPDGQGGCVAYDPTETLKLERAHYDDLGGAILIGLVGTLGLLIWVRFDLSRAIDELKLPTPDLKKK